MSSAAALRADLQALFGDEGRALTVRRPVLAAYDAATGTAAASSDSDYDGVGRLGDYRDSVVDGTLIMRGDRRCTFVPDDAAFAPQATDELIVASGIGAGTYGVIDVKARELGGAGICYTLQVRKGGA